jgi:MoaA/NifB/PqqE/SkfB family radical SAM enzyme
LVLTDRCNLQCRHCRLANRGIADLSFEEATVACEAFYKEGGRTLYLQGGEPLMWRDGHYTIEDIVAHSRDIGFYSVIIYTNGTIPINTSANTVFISIDGPRETHDRLRGATFDTIMNNIRLSTHPSLYINFTINSINRDTIGAFCEYIETIENIRGIFFYFHTPYYGYDELYIGSDERNEILLRLMEYKKKYKILNSLAGLKSALQNDWARPLDICRVYEKGKTYTCCRYPDNPELCRDCGYLSYAEIDQTLKLKPSAIVNALKYF